MFEIGQVVRGTVEKVVFGGKGLIRLQGWVIFVPDVACGEVVDVEITAKKKSYFEAKLISIVSKSPLRVQAPCPYYGTCGGCQLQHLAYDEQLKAKKEWLEDALRRIGKIEIDFPILANCAKKQWGYRRKIILHREKNLLGFYARDNKTLIDIASCPLFSSKGFAEIRSLQELPSKVTVMRNEQDVFTVGKSHSPQILEREVEGLRILYSPHVFVQNDPEQALQIYQDVLGYLNGGPLLDLYCGIGVLSLLAAKKGCEVLGVELDKEAIKLAQQSAKENGLSRAHFQALACEDIESLQLSKFGQWVVNPPRVGLSEKVLQIIARNSPALLVYISCMPATLARDSKILCEHGYKITHAQVYDMFAQTTHLETVVYFNLRPN